MLELPEAFSDRIRHQLGPEADSFFASIQQPSPISIRLHPQKGKCLFPLAEKVAWCDNGYFLQTRPAFQLDPHWHAGAYYVQEASSMILDDVIRQLNLDDNPRIWLDLCAAPGGKTGILAKHRGPADVLVANEVVPSRKSILRENLVKAGYLNTMISGVQAETFKTSFADIILIDAPCAGEGMMRKDPEAIRQWSLKLVESCSILQQKIVHHATNALNQDGYLIYSTCSYSPEENIQNIQTFLNTLPLELIPLHFPAEWNILEIKSGTAIGYQLFPHRVKGEGLFIAVLKKMADSDLPKHGKTNSFFTKLPSNLSVHLPDSNGFVARKNSPTTEFISETAESLANEVIRHIPNAEILAEVGEIKGKDFIPSHSLAMSGKAIEKFGIIKLDLETGLDYLERKSLNLPSMPVGWYLVQFDNSVLGWVKSTSQGWKNHYPMTWRLRDRRKG